MAHLHSLFHLGVHCGAVSGERVKLSPLIFFFLNLSAALYYLNAWKKTGYLVILVYLPNTLDRVLRVLVKRQTSAVEARAPDSRAGGLGSKRNQYGGKSDCATRL